MTSLSTAIFLFTIIALSTQQVAIFSINSALLHEIDQATKNNEDMEQFKGRSTLKLIQSIKTIPSAFPTKMNTCGRICVHESGRFVIVSNRGHESITIFRVEQRASGLGELYVAGYYHTRGETPRHFQFDASGQWLIVANQDSDTIAIFSFDLRSGEIKYSGNEYHVPSPNFVCCCTMNDEIKDKNDHGVDLFLDKNIIGTTPDLIIETPGKKELAEELLRARLEIQSLKEMISSLTVKDQMLMA